MRETRLFIIFAIAFIPIHSLVFAQPSNGITISGYVFDAGDQQPINYVNVFLNNTMLGDATDKDGYFKIKNVPLGSYELVVSHIGYRSEQKQISITGLQNQYYEFKVTSRTHVLPEISISASEARDWQKQLENFKRYFLGASENARQCRIINPEVLSFEVDESANKFAATAEDVIVIENNALGYRIHFLLDIFTKYDENIVYFGRAKFELLKPTNIEELEKWQETRLEVYKGSLRHFLHAFVSKKLHNEGFLVLKTRSIYDSKTFNLVSDSESGNFFPRGNYLLKESLLLMDF